MTTEQTQAKRQAACKAMAQRATLRLEWKKDKTPSGQVMWVAAAGSFVELRVYRLSGEWVVAIPYSHSRRLTDAKTRLEACLSAERAAAEAAQNLSAHIAPPDGHPHVATYLLRCNCGCRVLKIVTLKISARDLEGAWEAARGMAERIDERRQLMGHVLWPEGHGADVEVYDIEISALADMREAQSV